MSAKENDVLSQAGKLGDALMDAKDKMSPSEFLMLLIELNQKIEEVTKINYGSVCLPAYDCNNLQGSILPLFQQYYIFYNRFSGSVLGSL